MKDTPTLPYYKRYHYLFLLLGACLLLSTSGFTEEPLSSTHPEILSSPLLESATPFGQEGNKVGNAEASAWINPDGSIETSGNFFYGGRLATGPSYLFSPYSYKNKISLESPAVALCANKKAVAARCQDGTIFVWGDASYGGAPRGKIITIPGDDPNIKAEQLLANNSGFAVVLSNQKAWLWGSKKAIGNKNGNSGLLLPINTEIKMAGPFSLFPQSFFTILEDGRLYSWHLSYCEYIDGFPAQKWKESFLSSPDQEPIVNYLPFQKEGYIGVIIISTKGMVSFWSLLESTKVAIIEEASDQSHYFWKEDNYLRSLVNFPVTNANYNQNKLLLEGAHGESLSFTIKVNNTNNSLTLQRTDLEEENSNLSNTMKKPSLQQESSVVFVHPL